MPATRASRVATATLILGNSMPASQRMSARRHPVGARPDRSILREPQQFVRFFLHNIHSKGGADMGKFIELKSSDGHKLAAYVAQPAGKPRGGVVGIPEIFGGNRHIQ